MKMPYNDTINSSKSSPACNLESERKMESADNEADL